MTSFVSGGNERLANDFDRTLRSAKPVLDRHSLASSVFVTSIVYLTRGNYRHARKRQRCRKARAFAALTRSVKYSAWLSFIG